MLKNRRFGRRSSQLEQILDRLPGIDATYGAAVRSADPEAVARRLQRMRNGSYRRDE